MPGTFAGYEIVASTKNFLITCADDFVARNQALAISYCCEADLTRLQQLFSTTFQVGETIDHGVWVNVLKDDDPNRTFNGFNYGYETEESSRIVIGRAFTPPPPPPPPLLPPDPPFDPGPNLNQAVLEFPQRVFVAELAEILMGFTGYGWVAGQSHGEALSAVLGALLHPRGYYDTGQGPRVNQWFNGYTPTGKPFEAGRGDFVTNTGPSDTDFVTFGCGILFINYMVDQLGHSLQEVIRAGAGTLAATYAQVAKLPANMAFNNFYALISAHVDSRATFVGLDTIFPLYDPQHRSVSVNGGDPVILLPARDAKPTKFKQRPGLFCPEALYDFTGVRSFVRVPVYAYCTGFLNANFQWQANGMALPTHGAWASVTINTPVTVRNPDQTTSNVDNTTTLKYFIRDRWNHSEVFLKNTSTEGDCTVTMTAMCSEAGINKDPQTSGASDVDITAVAWEAGAQLVKDRKRCNPFYARVNKSIWGLTEKLSDLKNRPDPPSERAVQQVIDAVSQVQDAVSRYAKAGHMSAAEVLQQLSLPGGLRSKDAPPPESSVRSAQQAAAPKVGKQGNKGKGRG